MRINLTQENCIDRFAVNIGEESKMGGINCDGSRPGPGPHKSYDADKQKSYMLSVSSMSKDLFESYSGFCVVQSAIEDFIISQNDSNMIAASIGRINSAFVRYRALLGLSASSTALANETCTQMFVPKELEGQAVSAYGIAHKQMKENKGKPFEIDPARVAASASGILISSKGDLGCVQKIAEIISKISGLSKGHGDELIKLKDFLEARSTPEDYIREGKGGVLALCLKSQFLWLEVLSLQSTWAYMNTVSFVSKRGVEIGIDLNPK